MSKRYFPAVLERGPKKAFGVWFPDFPDCVAAGTSQEEALERAQGQLARAVVALAEKDKPLPAPTPMESIVLPKGCDFITFVAIGVEPPDISERVNVYLPKQLIAHADEMASKLGMNRSSFFGFALTQTIAGYALNPRANPRALAAALRLQKGKGGPK